MGPAGAMLKKRLRCPIHDLKLLPSRSCQPEFTSVACLVLLILGDGAERLCLLSGDIDLSIAETLAKLFSDAGLDEDRQTTTIGLWMHPACWRQRWFGTPSLTLCRAALGRSARLWLRSSGNRPPPSLLHHEGISDSEDSKDPHYARLIH